MTSKSTVFMLALAALLTGAAFALGHILAVSRDAPMHVGGSVKERAPDMPLPVISYGWEPHHIFDFGYEAAGIVDTVPGAVAGLTAHHLLIPEKIAEVFQSLRAHDGKTIVLVSPNHFHRGTSIMQIAQATWETPYGNVETDLDAVQRLQTALPALEERTEAFRGEHGVNVLTPFIRRSLPSSRIVAIMLDDKLTTNQAWQLGEAIARELPDAIFVGSIDMVHQQDAATTARIDADILATLDAYPACADATCVPTFLIDSNPTFAALYAFSRARGGSEFVLTHHGSSFEMGAVKKFEDNVSHILGVFH